MNFEDRYLWELPKCHLPGIWRLLRHKQLRLELMHIDIKLKDSQSVRMKLAKFSSSKADNPPEA